MFIVRDQPGTRDRVRTLISSDGPLTAAAIATRLGLTAAAVRRHLDALADEGAIEGREERPASRHRGRPARAYVLSEAGHGRLGSAYDDVATSALRFLAERAGPDAVAEFARERMLAFEQRYAAKLADAPDAESRARALGEALTADGFAASIRPVPVSAPAPAPAGGRAAGTARAGLQLCQGHCPVQHVAAQFPQLCDAETDAFSRLLGVHVQRLATLAHGEHVCTTFVPTPAAVPALDAAEPKPRIDEETDAP